jgi:phosphoribosylaminoimidazole-succinocarboxamide synthase
MSRNKPLYEGKAKILYEGPEPGTIIQYFKDDTTAGNGEKHAIIAGKGVLNNRISEYILSALEDIGINTHFIKTLNMREQLVKAVEIIPVEVVVRNVTAGSLAKRFDVEEGIMMPYPIVEYYLKSDKLNDPMVTSEHILAFEWAVEEELEEMKKIALRVNDFMTGMFKSVKIKLVDFKIEFGRVYDEEGNIYLLLADEISPDSCRLWDTETGEKLDKDLFRRDEGDIATAYHEVARRLGIITDEKKLDESSNVKPLQTADKKKPQPIAKKKPTPTNDK